MTQTGEQGWTEKVRLEQGYGMMGKTPVDIDTKGLGETLEEIQKGLMSLKDNISRLGEKLLPVMELGDAKTAPAQDVRQKHAAAYLDSAMWSAEQIYRLNHLVNEIHSRLRL